jgi:hypothetical protein
VFDRSKQHEEAAPVLWLGAKTAEITDVVHLTIALQPFCKVPDSTASALLADQQAGKRI